MSELGEEDKAITRSASAADEEDAYLAQRQSTMDSATLDKLLRAEKHLLQAGQATANAWRLIGRAPTDADNPSGGSDDAALQAAELSSSPPQVAGGDRRAFHHTAPANGSSASPSSGGGGGGAAQASSPRFPMAIPRPDGGRSSLGAYPANYDRHLGGRVDFHASTSSLAEGNNVMAENGRSRSTHGNLFGYTRDSPPLSDVTLFTFTVKKSDSVLEKLGSRRASIQLQVDIEARMLNFLSPHDARESYSCAAVTAKPQARLGMQLKIQTNTATLNKKITFFSVEDRANFVQALEEGKVMYRNKPSPHPAGGNSHFAASSASVNTTSNTPANSGNPNTSSAPSVTSAKESSASSSTAIIENPPYQHHHHLSISSRAPTEIADDASSVISGEFTRSKIRESIVTDHFGLLPGESVLEHVQRVTNLVVMSQSDRAVQGVLKITSYRITFTPYDANWKFGSFELPLAAIDLITRDGLMLLISCKDMRTLRLAMHDAYSRKKGYDQLPSTPDFRWLNLLTLRMKPPNMIGALFAFDFHTEKAKERITPLTEMTNGWFVYSPFAEYQRLGFLTAHKNGGGNAGQDEDGNSVITWRLLKNSKFRFSPTYPQLMVVPSLMSEEQLVQSARFRSRARLPVVVWRHPVNKSVLSRSSQPNYGMAGNRSEPDRILLRAYRDSANKNSAGISPPLHIIDARKPIATKGNRLKGKGVENSQHYDNAQIEFMGIANIHKMRESWDALKALVSPSSVEDGDKHYHNRLENTRWLKHVMRVLSGARRVAEVLHEDGASVLVHCSDGWDRTPQLVALAQLILDPYYRSIRGFAALVEKEWCSFGHKFADRIGVGKDITDQPNERSPVMLQFLDCVWQMTRQFPTCFEFNEKFLLHIADSTISGLYGTFLYNSERERFLDKVWERTESVWTPVLENPAPFRNPLYRQTNRVLYPRANLKRVVLWDAMFFRWDPESHPDYMEYMEPVHQQQHSRGGANSGDNGQGRYQDDNASEFGANDLSGPVVGGVTMLGNRLDPTAGITSPSILPIDAGVELDAEEKAMQLEIDGIHDYDEFRSKLTLSDCSDMSDDDDNFDMSPSDNGADDNNGGSFGEVSPPAGHMPASVAANLEELFADFDGEVLSQHQRGLETRTRQRAQGRNLRDALKAGPDQSRIKYLEQLLDESVGRELQLEAELESVLHRITSIRGEIHAAVASASIGS